MLPPTRHFRDNQEYAKEGDYPFLVPEEGLAVLRVGVQNADEVTLKRETVVSFGTQQGVTASLTRTVCGNFAGTAGGTSRRFASTASCCNGAGVCFNK